MVLKQLSHSLTHTQLIDAPPELTLTCFSKDVTVFSTQQDQSH